MAELGKLRSILLEVEMAVMEKLVGSFGERVLAVGQCSRLTTLAVAVVGALVLGACKHPVDLFCDENNPCLPRYPNKPFCDLTGAYSESDGIAKTCISACTPGQPLRCDGQNLLYCSQDGTHEESVTCASACNESVTACDDASLSGLTTSVGVLDPAFQPGLLEYDLDLVFAESAVTFTPTAAVPPSASITIDGSAVASDSASSQLVLSPGSRDVQIVVTEGTASTTYTIHVHRGVDALADLTTSDGTVSPVFSSSTTSYTAAVVLATDSITLTPTALIPSRTTITVDSGVMPSETVSSGMASSPIVLAEGANALSVVVTPLTRPAQTYALELHRGSDAIGAIQFSFAGGTLTNRLSPLFDPATRTYTLDVGLWLQEIQVAATPLVPGATLTIGGGPVSVGAPSSPISLNLGATSIPIVVTGPNGTSSGSYNLTVNRAASVAQRAFRKSSNAGVDDSLGYSVALYGDSLAIGAPGESSASTGIVGTNENDDSADSAGAVYVFTRNSAGAWSQQAYIKASNTDAQDGFGTSVALWGDTLAVGAPGESSAAVGINGNQADDSAYRAGAVYVFTRAAGAWSQQAYIKASNTGAGDEFGISIALWGDTLAVAAPSEDSAAAGVDGNEADNSASESGAVYTFTRSAGIWSQDAYLKASNTDSGDSFGLSIAVWGDTLAVGAIGEDSVAAGIDGNSADDTASSSGAVYVFIRGVGGWSQQAYVKASNTDALDLFGSSVALWGDRLAVGARHESSASLSNQSDNSAARRGAVYVFVRSGTSWSQQSYIKAQSGESDDWFGDRVALWGDLLAISAPGEDSAATNIDGNRLDNSASESGAVYVYRWTAASTWIDWAYVKASNTESGDYFAGGGLGLVLVTSSVALWGDTLAVGAHGEDSASTPGAGQSDNSVENSGALYIFQ